MKFEISALGYRGISGENCNDLGATLSKLFGLPNDICWLAANHVLSAVGASDCVFQSAALPGKFRAGGLILVGDTQRIRFLMDWLLAPVERIQSQCLAAQQTADRNVLDRYMREDQNPVIRGLTKSFFEKPRSANDGHADRTQLARTLDFINRPLWVIRNPNRNTVMSGLSLTYGHSPLVVEDELHSHDTVNDKTYLKWLAAGLGGSHDWEGSTEASKTRRSVDSCPALLASMTQEDFAATVARPHSALYQLFRHSLTIPLELKSPQPPPEKSELMDGEAESACNIWWQAIEKAIDHRSSESHQKWNLSIEDTRFLVYCRNEILEAVKESPAVCKNLRSTLPELPARSIWCFKLLNQVHKCTPPDIHNKLVHLAGNVRKAQDRIFQEVEHARIQSEIERNKNSILRAVQRSGGNCEWAEIRRSLRRQSYTENEPAIRALLSEGSLQQGPDGVYRLPSLTEKTPHEQ